MKVKLRLPNVKELQISILLIIISVFFYCVSSSITTTNINNKQFTDFNYVTPSAINKSIDWWVSELKKTDRWSVEIQQRVNAIEKVRFVSYHNMPNYEETGRPLAMTTYKVVDGVLLPKELIFSQTITFDELGMKFVVFHELGHAILMLDDMDETCHKFNEQIMWHRGLASYYKFGDSLYFDRRLKEQFRMPDDKKMIDEFLNAFANQKRIDKQCKFKH